MTFSQALECINDFYVVAREQTPNVIITRQVSQRIPENVIPKMSSLPTRAKDIILRTCKTIHYHNQLLKIDILTGDATTFVVTTEDLYATDWFIVE